MSSNPMSSAAELVGLIRPCKLVLNFCRSELLSFYIETAVLSIETCKGQIFNAHVYTHPPFTVYAKMIIMMLLSCTHMYTYHIYAHLVISLWLHINDLKWLAHKSSQS